MISIQSSWWVLIVSVGCSLILTFCRASDQTRPITRADFARILREYEQQQLITEPQGVDRDDFARILRQWDQQQPYQPNQLQTGRSGGDGGGWRYHVQNDPNFWRSIYGQFGQRQPRRQVQIPNGDGQSGSGNYVQMVTSTIIDVYPTVISGGQYFVTRTRFNVYDPNNNSDRDYQEYLNSGKVPDSWLRTKRYISNPDEEFRSYYSNHLTPHSLQTNGTSSLPVAPVRPSGVAVASRRDQIAVSSDPAGSSYQEIAPQPTQRYRNRSK